MDERCDVRSRTAIYKGSKPISKPQLQLTL